MQKVVLFFSIVGFCSPLIARSAEVRLDRNKIEMNFPAWVAAIDEVDQAFARAQIAASESHDVRKMNAEIKKMVLSANKGDILLLPSTITGLQTVYNSYRSRRGQTPLTFTVIGQYSPYTPVIGPYSLYPRRGVNRLQAPLKNRNK